MPEEKLEALPNPKHLPSSWTVSAKPTGSQRDAEEQRELSWFSGLWQPVVTLPLPPGTPLPHAQLAPPRGLWLHQKWLSWDLAAFVKGVQRDSGGWQRTCGDWSACPGESS